MSVCLSVYLFGVILTRVPGEVFLPAFVDLKLRSLLYGPLVLITFATARLARREFAREAACSNASCAPARKCVLVFFRLTLFAETPVVLLLALKAGGLMIKLLVLVRVVLHILRKFCQWFRTTARTVE